MAIAMPLSYGVVAVLASDGLVAVLVLSAIGVCLVHRSQILRRPRIPGLFVFLCALALLWMALSFMRSVPGADGVYLARILALGVAGLVICAGASQVSNGQKKFTGIGLIAGCIIGMGLLVEELATSGFLTNLLYSRASNHPDPQFFISYLGPGATLLSCIIFLSFISFTGKIKYFVCPIILCVFIALCVAVGASAALASILTALLIWALVLLDRKRAARLVKVGLIAAILVMPLVPVTLKSGAWVEAFPGSTAFSVHHRLEIWRFTAERILERPLLGWGFDASRAIPGGNELIRFVGPWAELEPEQRPNAVTMPLHPHNGILQIWLELGLVGAMLLTGLVLVLFRAIDRMAQNNAAIHSMLYATFAATFTVFCLSFGAWQSRWQAAMWLIAGLAIVMGSETCAEKADD